MFERLSRSWALVKASAAVLKQDRQLLVFPLISALATVVLVAAFALPVFGLGWLDGLTHGQGNGTPAAAYGLGFLFYVSLYFIIFFFNAALIGAALIRFDGGSPTVGDGLRIANSKFGQILGYAVIAATVGMVLRMIQERVGFIGRLIVGLLGVGWTLATFLVVPVLVSRDVGPVDAVKESAGILKKTWGENVVGQSGIGVVFTVLHFVVVIAGVALVMAALSSGSGLAFALALLLTLAAVALTALVQTALTGIYAAALYRYAATGQIGQGFDGQALQQAFAPKR